MTNLKHQSKDKIILVCLLFGFATSYAIPDFMKSQDSLSHPESFPIPLCFLSKSFHCGVCTCQNWKPNKFFAIIL